ncbi:MAG: transglycosylase SLT domain-containing protein [Marinifilaceae bacterium]|nr:transglycosylase SLT domain-containing protein [Marinifilaceae bacterium]
MEFLRLICAILLCSIVTGCNNGSSNGSRHSAEEDENSITDTSLRRNVTFAPVSVIKGAINHNTTDFYVLNGATMGFHHDLLRHYADSRGREIELEIINEDYDTIRSLLQNGKCDVVAMNSSPDYGDTTIFHSDPIIHNDIVIVTPRVKDATTKELIAGRYVSVKKGSRAAEALNRFRDTCGYPFFIVELSSSVTSEEMFNDVMKGVFAGTANYRHKARTACYRMPGIGITEKIEESAPICWEFRSAEARDDFNNWLKEFKAKGNVAYLYRRYYRNREADHIIRYGQIYSPRLSEYDEIFKRESRVLDWDWRLIAAVAFTESQFKDTIESAHGAYGLMQIQEVAATQFGVQDYFRADSNIYVGVRYLNYLDNMFAKYIENPEERIRFTLASYNAGYGHIFDAMRLAKEFGYSDTTWSGSVENFLLIKSEPQFRESAAVRNGSCDGKQSVDFVRRVLRSYRSYTQTKKME